MFKYPCFPTAPPTSIFPCSFNGNSICGFCIYALTFGVLSDTAIIEPIGPFPFICALMLSFSFFNSTPINATAVNNLPSAAVVVGVKSCIFLASSTSSVDSITVIKTF